MMIKRMIWGMALALLLLAGCQEDGGGDGGETAVSSAATEQTTSPPTATSPPTPIPTDTPIPPTPTPTEPLAARVNGQPITVAEFEQELARYELAQEQLGQPVQDTSHRQLVLNALIERELLIYEATVNRGYSLTAEALNDRFLELQTAAGGSANFQAWLNSNLWTQTAFLEALRGEMLITRVRDELDAQVPRVAEQIQASYIQLDNFELAQSIATELAAGADFSFLAQQHSLDRITGENGGDLGYFARGALLVPELEEAAFALAEPGNISNIISVMNAENGSTTHFIVQLLARDEERPLTSDMRLTMLQQAYDDLLQSLQETAEIVILDASL